MALTSPTLIECCAVLSLGEAIDQYEAQARGAMASSRGPLVRVEDRRVARPCRAISTHDSGLRWLGFRQRGRRRVLLVGRRDPRALLESESGQCFDTM